MWGQDNNTDTDTNTNTEIRSSDQSNATQSSSGAKSIIGSAEVLSKMDDKFEDLYNNIVGSLNTYNTYSSKIQSIEVQDLSKQLKANTKQSLENNVTEDEKLNDDVKHLLNANNNDILGNLNDFSVPNERKKRYKFYDELPEINYIVYRMLKVFIDNILIKNVQTKQFLNINPNPNNVNFLNTIQKDIGKHYENFLKTSSVYFNLQKKLKDRIIPEMLKYGNSFIEILNLKNVSEIASKTHLINESYIMGDDFNPSKQDYGYCNFESLFDTIEEGAYTTKTKMTASDKFAALLKSEKMIEESSSNYFDDLTNSEFKFDDINDLEFDAMHNLYLKHINPNQVLIVEEDGILYGYLVVDEIKESSGTEIDIFKRFTQQDNSKNGANNETIQKEVVEKMTDGIVRKLNETIHSSYARNLNGLDLSENVENSIKIILYHKIKEKKKLNFRFIPPNKFVNFSASIDKFGPYGTSIFEPVVQPVKMYTLALMSSIVSRLSRASVVRKWTIEAGNKKNHAEIIEKVKKDINNKSISFDSLSNIKNVSSLITDFRDLATIQVNGQRFIDMEVMPMGDRSLPLNDMNDLRNELVASTGIPSVYLNIGDQVDLRESLVNLNTSFATTISSYQGNIDESLSHLMNSIFSTILENNDYNNNDFLLSNYYSFSLNPPLVLTVQANEALISSVTNIIGMLKSSEVVVDPEALLKLYIPQMNWDDLIKTGDSFIKKTAKDQLIADTSGSAGDGSSNY